MLTEIPIAKVGSDNGLEKIMQNLRFIISRL